MMEFRKGHSSKKKLKKGMTPSALKSEGPSPRALAIMKRGAKERPEQVETIQCNKVKKIKYKSDIRKMLKYMREQQKMLEDEEKLEIKMRN
jgi:hypothetical protein